MSRFIDADALKSKEYKLPNGETAVFEYDHNGIGKITLECLDELMAMITDRPQGEWEILASGVRSFRRCTVCKWKQTYSDPRYTGYIYNYCPNCGARMKGADDVLKGDR